MKKSQNGFSLIELMIGSLLGLIAALVITNVFLKFEQQKRLTTGGADAQTSGSIAMYSMRRDIENAGYGLPVFASDITPLRCPVNLVDANLDVRFNHDNVVAATSPEIGLTPVVITDGGTGSDQISVRYGTSMSGGASADIQAGSTNTPPTAIARLSTNLGCNKNDVALIMQEDTATTLKCSMARVTAVSASGVSPQTIDLAGIATTSVQASVADGSKLACLGAWNQNLYAVRKTNANYELTRTGEILPPTNVTDTPLPSAAAVSLVPDVVNIQAQYGISDIETDNQVKNWVDATGNIWANPTPENRNRIKAVRIAIVSRNALPEQKIVSQECTGSANGVAKVCIWNETAEVDLTGITNWQNYRYRVYETVIPLRNVLWNRKVLNGDA